MSLAILAAAMVSLSIATGFERSGVPRRLVEAPLNERREQSSLAASPASRPASQPPANRDFQPRAFNTEDLDIPTFLRNRSR